MEAFIVIQRDGRTEVRMAENRQALADTLELGTVILSRTNLQTFRRRIDAVQSTSNKLNRLLGIKA